MSVKMTFADEQRKNKMTGNELADVAKHRGRSLFFRLASALQKVLQTPPKCRCAVATQLENQNLREENSKNYNSN